MLTISPEKIVLRDRQGARTGRQCGGGGARRPKGWADPGRLYDPTLEELTSFLEAQSDDELSELLALAWVGRGDFGADERQDALRQAQDVRAKHTIGYLPGTPLLPDYLEERLAQCSHSCGE